MPLPPPHIPGCHLVLFSFGDTVKLAFELGLQLLVGPRNSGQLAARRPPQWGCTDSYAMFNNCGWIASLSPLYLCDERDPCGEHVAISTLEEAHELADLLWRFGRAWQMIARG